MGTFVHIMQKPYGRGVRVMVGAALIGLGIWGVSGTGGVLLALVGAVPLVAGAGGVCLIGPFFGYKLDGTPM